MCSKGFFFSALSLLAFYTPPRVLSQALPYRTTVEPALLAASKRPDSLPVPLPARSQKVGVSLDPPPPQEASLAPHTSKQRDPFKHSSSVIIKKTEPQHRQAKKVQTIKLRGGYSSKSTFITAGLLIALAAVLIPVGIILVYGIPPLGGVLLALGIIAGLSGLIMLLLALIFPTS